MAKAQRAHRPQILPERHRSHSIEPLEERLLLARTIYVDAASTATSPDGSSWSKAYADLQLALAAAVSGDQIHVAQGTYKPTTTLDRNKSFTLKSGVGLTGGYAGPAAADPDARDWTLYPSILSGDIGQVGINTDNSMHVVFAQSVNSATMLDGFTIADGYTESGHGGGMYNSTGAATTISNCLFTRNYASSGGGLYNTAAPAVSNCVFADNSAINGGGIYNNSGPAALNNCTFNGNSANMGGGVYNSNSGVTISACVFTGNTATAWGGAMDNENSNISNCTNCVFQANVANLFGGAIYNNSSFMRVTGSSFLQNSAGRNGGAIENFSSSPQLTRCQFLGNSANGGGFDGQGGAIINFASASPTVLDCIFVGNTAGVEGGAIASLSQSKPTIINCTVSGNAAYQYGGATYNDSTQTIVNSILWGNAAPTASEIYQPTTAATVTYSDVRGGYAGSGNTNIDPLFSRDPSAGADDLWATNDDDYGDLRLQACSPAADAGSNAAVPAGTTTDFAGGNRFRDILTTSDSGAGTAPLVDMGAYEAAAALSVSAGGPYLVLEGQDIQLRGFGSSNVAGNLTFDWDWYSDGSFDASGASPVFPSSNIAPGSIIPITLRLTDGASTSVMISTTVKIAPIVVYVDARATGDSSGISWVNAIPSLAQAMREALPGQQLHVAGGTYRPTPSANRHEAFQLKSDVAVMGGFAGLGGPNPNDRNWQLSRTILSGDIGITEEDDDNSYNVVIASGVTSTAILDGFIVTDAHADPEGASLTAAGMYTANAASPTITNCIFTRNSADGMYNTNSSPSITNCVFSGNETGMFNTMSSPLMLNVVFVGNTGTAIANSTSSAVLINCTITANTGTSVGAAIQNGNCTTTITNSIIWGNSSLLGAPFSLFGTGGLLITYSDVQGGFAGAGNVDVEPLFVRNPAVGADLQWGTPDDDYGDLRLEPYSPGVDLGSNAAVPTAITTDLAGANRFQDVPTAPDAAPDARPNIDMGAYEASASLAASAGGPYTVVVGGDVHLSGWGASDSAGPLLFEWDWNGDGMADSTGPQATFPTAGLSAGSIIPVQLLVTDGNSQTVAVQTTVTIEPTIVHVDSRAAAGGSGASWGSAVNSLATALAQALPGQTIDVAQGTYTPASTGNRSVSFRLLNQVRLVGGFAGLGAADPDAHDPRLYPTTLSGDIGAPGDASDNSYHVVSAFNVDATASIEGFVITGGNASTDSGSFDSFGGGMLDYGASPTIIDCVFTGNTSSSRGAGMSNQNSSSPSLTDCIFIGNVSASGGGGAMHNDASSPVLVHCSFVQNTGYAGGAMNNEYSSSPSIINCVFLGNSAATNGGGAMYNYTMASPILINCALIGNVAKTNGGGIVNQSASVTLINCVVAFNTASTTGGGIDCSSSSATVTNSILWGNSAPTGKQTNPTSGSSFTITNSDVQGGTTTGGNLNSDPLFARSPSAGADGKWATPDDDYGDLHLRPGSPAINAGSNAAVPAGTTTDLDGYPRILDSTVDMGAYELQLLSPTPGDAVSIPAGSFRLESTANLSSLTLTNTASLDLLNHDLIISYAESSPEGQLQQYVQNWLTDANAPKLLASRSNDASSPFPRTLAISDNRDLKFASFAGQTFAPGDFNQVLVKYTYFGDSNLDGQVTPTDYAIIDGNIGLGHDWGTGDLNADGKVNPSDYAQIDGNIGAGNGAAGGPTLESLDLNQESALTPVPAIQSSNPQPAFASPPATPVEQSVAAMTFFSTRKIDPNADLLMEDDGLLDS